MSDERPPGMSEEFQARMRLGLSTMAVRERVRERRRNRAIAGGAVAAAVVALVAVLGGQVLAGGAGERDAAVPTQTAEPTTEPTFDAETREPTPEPTETAPAEPTAPPGFEGVAARQQQVFDFFDCGASGCGDAGAAGGPSIEGEYDVYVLCEISGQVLFGGAVWIDCAQATPGTGWAMLNYRDVVGDGDPEFTTSDDFDGRLDVLPRGELPQGDPGAETASVYFDCGVTANPVIGGVAFDCNREMGVIPELGAWGIPLAPGSYAPSIELDTTNAEQSVRWRLER